MDKFNFSIHFGIVSIQWMNKEESNFFQFSFWFIGKNVIFTISADSADAPESIKKYL